MRNAASFHGLSRFGSWRVWKLGHSGQFQVHVVYIFILFLYLEKKTWFLVFLLFRILICHDVHLYILWFSFIHFFIFVFSDFFAFWFFIMYYVFFILFVYFFSCVSWVFCSTRILIFHAVFYRFYSVPVLLKKHVSWFFLLFSHFWCLKRPQAYGDIVDDLVIKMKGLTLKPREQTYRAFMFAYGKWVYILGNWE